MSELTHHYDEVAARLARAAAEDGRSADEVRLLAVSKTFPAEMIRELYEHGVRLFGESRAPELAEKAAALPANKVRKVVQLAGVIHSVDTPELLTRIDRIAGEEGRRPVVLLEANVSGEESKAGVPVGELEAFARQAASLPNVDFQGFMTMAPFNAEPFRIAAIFELLKLTRDELEGKLNRQLPILSMGMSGDFEIAARHGSTLVRVGSLIFGAR